MNARTLVWKPAVVLLSVTVCVSSVPAEETPETRILSPQQAARVLQRDWLFQAMGEPLPKRAANEIGWARELARRIGGKRRAPDLSAELRELDALEKRLAELRDRPTQRPRPGKTRLPPTERAEAVPSWIWYPEGNAADDAPAEVRFFRCRFELREKVRAAELRVAADDACDVYLGGTHLGAHQTWQRTAVFAVEDSLKPGANVLAIRAENRPAPTKNPAGLIVRLTVTLADGKQVVVVSDGSWRAERRTHRQWEQAAFDDSAWKPVTVVAPFGGGPG